MYANLSEEPKYLATTKTTENRSWVLDVFYTVKEFDDKKEKFDMEHNRTDYMCDVQLVKHVSQTSGQ